MNDPLAALKPLHHPESISWWPLAPGWWVLLALLLVVALLATWRRYRLRLQRLALQELGELQSRNLVASAMANQVNQLLKRYALVCFPRTEVAGLSGKQWLRFLRQHSDEHEFARAGNLLLDAPYKRDAEKGEEKALAEFAASWIKRNKPGVRR